MTATSGRPRVLIQLGDTDIQRQYLALVDTGASCTLVRQDVAEETLRRCKRPLCYGKATDYITSVTGNPLDILGTVDFMIPNVGVITAFVVKDMSHEIIIGYDVLTKYGFFLNPEYLLWGNDIFNFCSNRDNVHVNSLECDSTGLSKLIHDYRMLFREGDLAPAHAPPMEIQTMPGKIVRKRPYRTALAKRAVVEQEIEKMLKMNIIRPSHSSWSSPITLVPKKDGTIRFCVDYRALNEITIKDRYPLPLIQDIFDTLNGSAIYSTLDLRSGYWQLPMAANSIEKTAFVCHCGQFEFLRMPFGLTNAPAVFQRVMTSVLSQFIGKFAMVYLDDVIIFSKTEEEHISHLRQVFDAFEKAGLTLKESKCHFGKSSLDLLGFVVSKDGVAAQPSKTSAISELSSPMDVSELRSFLGMSSYYRQLVPGFAAIAEPLYQLTRKNVAWHWGESQQSAFESLKSALVTSPVMAYPNTSKPYILYTDACDYAVGAILCQEDDEGVERPIQYLSQQLSPTQRRYAVIEKEAFAVVYALKKLRPYLLGSEFVIFTDHKPLLSFFTGEIANTKIQRWAILLAEYGAPIKYRPGPNNVRADMLSRIKSRSTETAVIDADAEWVTPQQVKEHLPPIVPVLADDLCMDTVLMAQIEEFNAERDLAREEDSRYCLIDNILYSISRPQFNVPSYPRLVLPSMFRCQVIKRCHVEVGHQSLFKTMARVQETYVWPGMKKDVREWISKCGLCQVHTKRKEKVSMGEMPIAHAPGQYVGIDLIGPLVPSRYSGARYIMTCIDHYDGWAEAYPLIRKTNEAVWERLRNEYIPRFSVPEVIITDQGSEFKGNEFKQWLEGMGIEHRRTTPYHPQSNGRSERFNGTLKRILRKLVNGDRADWEDQLGAALTAYRISTSTVTGHSPFMLRYVHPPRYPLTRMMGDDPSRTFENRLALQAELMQRVAQATEDSRQHNRNRLARQANAQDLQVGDKVILKAREPLSLTAQWDYGFIVTKTNGKAITILHPTTGVKQVVNRDQLRLVDPDIAWDHVLPRPKRVQARRPVPVGKRPVMDGQPEQAPPAPMGNDVGHSPRDTPIPEGGAPRAVAAPGQDDAMQMDQAVAMPDRDDAMQMGDAMQSPPLTRQRAKRLRHSSEDNQTDHTTDGNVHKRARWTVEEIAQLLRCLL